MQKQLIILSLFSTLSFSITIEGAMMLKYGSYISASVLFVLLVIGFLLYWTFYYKKLVKKVKLELKEREEELSTLNNNMQKNEFDSLKEAHKFEKQIAALNQDIKTLKDDLKKGLKSQVVSKIDEYESKRIKNLDRLGLKV